MSNTLGNREYFVYTDDTGASYNILTDEDLGTAGGLTVATAGNPTLPRRFKPRGVYVEAVVEGENVRKFLICSATSAAYDSNVSTAVTIDGTQFQTTGRRGEKVSFPRFSTGGV